MPPICTQNLTNMQGLTKSKKDYACGRTKVFIRHPQTIFEMERQRKLKMHYLATLIQKMYKGWKAWKRVSSTHIHSLVIDHPWSVAMYGVSSIAIFLERILTLTMDIIIDIEYIHMLLILCIYIYGYYVYIWILYSYTLFKQSNVHTYLYYFYLTSQYIE